MYYQQNHYFVIKQGLQELLIYYLQTYFKIIKYIL